MSSKEASNINLTISLNSKEKSFSLEGKSTINEIKSKAAREFKISPDNLDIKFKGKNITNDKATLKEVVGQNTKDVKITLEEKPNSNNNKSSKTNQASSEPKKNVIKTVQQSATVKVENYVSRNDLITIVESHLLSLKLAKDKDFTSTIAPQHTAFNIKSVDSAHSLYQHLVLLKSRNPVYQNIKCNLYLGTSKTTIKEYEYPAVPKNNINNSYNPQNILLKRDKVKQEKTEVEKFEMSFSRSHKQVLGSNKNKTSSTNMSALSESSILKHNIFLGMKIPQSLISNAPRKKEFLLLKQQEKLDVINPQLNRISSPYMSMEEKRLYEEGLSKEKWVSPVCFKKCSARKIPMIPNYVNATPSKPPVLYSFREVKKDQWMNKKGFKIL